MSKFFNFLLGIFTLIASTEQAFAGLAYVTDPYYLAPNVFVIDTTTNKVVATINTNTFPAFQTPYCTAVSPDGSTLYIGDTGANLVYVVNTITNEVTALVSSGSFASFFLPFAIVFNPNGGTAYICDFGRKAIYVVDTSTNVAIAQVSTNSFPAFDFIESMAISPDGYVLYVGDVNNNTFYTIDTTTNEVTATLFITPSSPELKSIVLTPSGYFAYLTLYVFNQDGSYVILVDLTTNTDLGMIRTNGFPPFEGLNSIAINRNGNTVYTPSLNNNLVYVIDTTTNQVTDTFDAGSFTPFLRPNIIAVSPNENIGYLTDQSNATVYVIDVTSNEVSGTVDSNGFPAFVQPFQVAFTPNFTQPSVTGVSPSVGGRGAPINITGTAFTGVQKVTFGGIEAGSITYNSDSSLTVTSPTGQPAGTVDVQVTTPYGTSTITVNDEFTYGPLPDITSLDPTTGSINGGTSINITGTAFTGVQAVTFDGVEAEEFTFNSDSSITAISPAGQSVGVVDVQVTTIYGPSETSVNDEFTYGSPPVTTSITPNTGSTNGGTSVSITGTTFTGVQAVTFGGVAAASFTFNSDTSITATSPAGQPPGLAEVEVTTLYGSSGPSALVGFTFVDPPTVTGVSPTTGSANGGTSVAITGTGFTLGSTVSFGSFPAANPNVISSTSILAISPPNFVETVDITVTNTYGTSATSGADQFTYMAAPKVTAISPTTGSTAGSTSVTITGTGFVGGSSVSFGNIVATNVTINSSTSITVLSPPYAGGTLDITVTTPYGTSPISGADKFTFIHPPVVTSVFPITGSTNGNTSVAITGTGFTNISAVTFGSVSAGSHTVNSNSSITATSPTGQPIGIVDITVTNPYGTSGTSVADGFTYAAPPTVTAVSPATGSANGGTSVTVTGTDFTLGSTISFGSASGMSPNIMSSSSILVTSPANSVGIVDIRVTSPYGVSPTTMNDEFTYTTPP